MENITIDIRSDGNTRASETIADLRNASEVLFFPMKLVGFWDHQAGMHLCPQEERRQQCPHTLPESDPARVDYATALQRERNANLELTFPHAGVVIYLS